MPETRETYGHEPTLSFIDGRALANICPRCHTTTTHYDEAYQPTRYTRPVRWPCGTAVLLGLTEPPDAA